MPSSLSLYYSRPLHIVKGDSQFLFHKNGKKYLDGSHHISCSKEHDQPWVFALGAESLSSHSGKQRVRVITFNKTYSNNIKSFYALNGLAGETSILDVEPGYFRVQRGSGYCYTTHPFNFKDLILEQVSIFKSITLCTYRIM